MKRDVRIILKGDTYFVQYVKRKKSQRYLAAQFYAKDHTVGSITRWLAENRPNLNLID